MSKEFFDKSEFVERQKKVQKEMEKQKLDAMIVISPININYLIGTAAKAYQVFQCLLFSREEGPETLLIRLSDVGEAMDTGLAKEVKGWGGRYAENPISALANILKDKKWKNGRIGLEMPAYYLSVQDYLALTKVLDQATVIDASDLIETLKLAKSPAEINYIRKAASIADIGIESLTRAIKEGRTEKEVAAEAHKAMMAAGGESPPSPMNFVSGERACYAHGLPTDRQLRRQDFMHIEFGGQYRRYCATIARHFSLGTPTQLAQEIHDVTNEACEAAISVIKEGVPIHYPHQVAKSVIEK